jgi:hypothetical protein
MISDGARRLIQQLALLLPQAWMAWIFASAVINPTAGASQVTLRDAEFLLKLEFLLLATAPLTLLAARVAARNRWYGLLPTGALVAILILWLVDGVAAASMAWGIALLVAGRFIAGAFGTEATRYDLYERWLISSAIFVCAVYIAMPLFLPTEAMLSGAEPWPLHAGALALHYGALLFLDLPGVYPRWMEPRVRRPTVIIKDPYPHGGASARLVFARDVLELVIDRRLRPSLRIAMVAAYIFFLGIPSGSILDGIRSGWISHPALWHSGLAIVALAGSAWILMRRTVDYGHVQIRHYEVAIFDVAGLTASTPRLLTDRDISGIESPKSPKIASYLAFTLIAGRFVWVNWGEFLVRTSGEALQRLASLYFHARITPLMLEEARGDDPLIASLVSPEIVAQMSAAAYAPRPGVAIDCPHCGERVQAADLRCPRCALPYPDLGDR